MIRLILIVVVVALTLLCGAAIVLYQYLGWKGLIALPFLVLAMVWVAKKMTGLVIKKFALGLFGMKSGALKGATMTVHSILPVAKPVEAEYEATEEDEAEVDTEDEVSSEDGNEGETELDDVEEPRL